jgi:hypothetical protein
VDSNMTNGNLSEIRLAQGLGLCHPHEQPTG